MDRVLADALLLINRLYTRSNKSKFIVIGNGFGSLVIESDQGIIFRIAKNLETAKQYLIESNVLPKIRHCLDINIPNPIWHIYNSTSTPYGIIGYSKLKGNPITFNKINDMNRSTIAKEVARFIISFHQISYENLHLDNITKRGNDKLSLAALCENTSGFLKSELDTEEYKIMEKWWKETLEDDTFNNYKSTLCHGDLWFENILVDDNYSHVVGIIDFSDMMIGDPAVDLAPQLYLGKEFYNEVLYEYTKVFKDDETINQRIKRHQELREMFGLQYIIKNNLIDESKDSISKIRNRVIFQNNLSIHEYSKDSY